eukprot:1358659-Amorphochlora_amoeboformis.AAC.1
MVLMSFLGLERRGWEKTTIRTTNRRVCSASIRHHVTRRDKQGLLVTHPSGHTGVTNVTQRDNSVISRKIKQISRIVPTRKRERHSHIPLDDGATPAQKTLQEAPTRATTPSHHPEGEKREGNSASKSCPHQPGREGGGKDGGHMPESAHREGTRDVGSGEDGISLRIIPGLSDGKRLCTN